MLRTILLAFVFLHAIGLFAQELTLQPTSKTTFCAGDTVTFSVDITGQAQGFNSFVLELTSNKGSKTIRSISLPIPTTAKVLVTWPQFDTLNPGEADTLYGNLRMYCKNLGIADTLNTLYQITQVAQPVVEGDIDSNNVMVLCGNSEKIVSNISLNPRWYSSLSPRKPILDNGEIYFDKLYIIASDSIEFKTYYTTTTSNGCESKPLIVNTKTIIVEEPVISGHSSVCENSKSHTYSLNLDVKDCVTNWSISGDHSIKSSTGLYPAQSVIIDYKTQGIDTIIVDVNKNSCLVSDTLIVSILPYPKPNFTVNFDEYSDKLIFKDISAPVEVTEGLYVKEYPITLYTWDFGGSSLPVSIEGAEFVAQNKELQYQYKTDGIYTVMLKIATSGCEQRVYKDVNSKEGKIISSNDILYSFSPNGIKSTKLYSIAGVLMVEFEEYVDIQQIEVPKGLYIIEITDAYNSIFSKVIIKK